MYNRLISVTSILFLAVGVLFACPILAEEKPRLLVDTGTVMSPYQFAFSTDNKLLVGTGGVGYQIWNMASGKQVAIGAGDYNKETVLLDIQQGKAPSEKDVRGKIFRRAGKTLLLKNEQKGYSLYVLPHFQRMGHIPYVYSNPTFALSSSGRFLFARDEQAEYGEVWDCKTGERVATLSGIARHPVVFGLSGDERWLFVRNNEIRVWNQKRRAWEGKPTKFTFDFDDDGAILHPNEQWMVASVRSYDPFVLFDVKTGKIRFRQNVPRPDFFAFSPNGKLLALRSYQSAYVFEVSTGKLLYHFLPQSKIVSHSRDGRVVLLSSLEGEFQVRNLVTASFWNLPKGYEEAFMTPNAKWVLASSDNELSVWSVESKRLLYKLPCPAHFYRSGFYQIAANDQWLITRHEALSLYEVASGKKITTVPFGEGGFQRDLARMKPEQNESIVRDEHNPFSDLVSKYAVPVKTSDKVPHLVGLQFSPANNLFVGWGDQMLYAFRLPNEKMKYFVELHRSPSIMGPKRYGGTMVFHPSGALFLEGIGAERHIVVRDSKTGTLQKVLKDFGRHTPQFSPDGKYLISMTGNPQRRVVLRDGKTLSVLRTLLEENCYRQAHRQRDAKVDRLELIMPNNKVFVTYDSSSSYSYWSIPNGQLLGTLYLCPKNECLFLTPDGRYDGTKHGKERLYWVRQKQAYPLQTFSGTKYVPGLLG